MTSRPSAIQDLTTELTRPRHRMLTYSGAGQEAIASYGADNVAKLRKIAKAYDPTGVFQRLVPGGQKLPHA